MPKKRKATAAMNIPSSYLYPPYGYVPPTPPSYNIDNRSPVQSDYIYYPLDERGRVIGPPTTLPPISANPHQQVFYPYSSNPPVYSSYLHSPRRDPIVYDDYYYRYPYSNRNYEKPRHENLPPLYRIPYPPAENIQYPQCAVRDLTERDSTTPILSNPNTSRRI